MEKIESDQGRGKLEGCIGEMRGYCKKSPGGDGKGEAK